MTDPVSLGGHFSLGRHCVGRGPVPERTAPVSLTPHPAHTDAISFAQRSSTGSISSSFATGTVTTTRTMPRSR
jgi:hypothetical protein